MDFKAFDYSYLFYFLQKNDFQEFAIHKNNLTTNNDKEYYIYINYVTGHGYDTFNQTFIHTVILIHHDSHASVSKHLRLYKQLNKNPRKYNYKLSKVQNK